MATQWFCCRISQGKETFAQLNLDRQGFETYLPMVNRTLKSGEVVKRPFFPAYLFVKADLDNPKERWQKIVSTFGVKGLLPPKAERPQPVQRWIIDEVKAREDCGVVRLDPHEICDFKPGDKVRLEKSPLDAVFQEMKGHDRAVILVSLFNKQLPKTVMLSRIQASMV